MDDSFAAEIGDLHRVLEDWLGGVAPRTADAYRGFSDAIADDFIIIAPDGSVTARDPVVARIEALHGIHAGPQNSFRIRIENCALRIDNGPYCLGTYEEWQDLAGRTTARLSTVLFRRRAGARNGLEWVHLHETWLPGHAPAP